MRIACTALAISTVSLMLAACVMQQTAPEVAVSPQMVDTVRSGRAILDCREPCLAAWRQAQPQAAQYDASGRWGELATVVLRTGFQDDLSLYYLGRAAEGLGAANAARRYYAESVQISATNRSCRTFSGECGGLSLPRTASARLAMLERGRTPGSEPLRRPRPQPPRPGSGQPNPGQPNAGQPIPLDAGTALPQNAGGPPPIDFPVAPPLEPPRAEPEPPRIEAPPPVASRQPTPQPPSDFIEPPPAPR